MGEVAKTLYDTITGIQTGLAVDDMHWVEEVI